MAWQPSDMRALMEALSLDLMDTFERLQSKPLHQPARRSWIRTLCSQVEAWMYSMKQMIATFSVLPFVAVQPADAFLLREEVPEVNEKGDIVIRGDRFLPWERNFKYVAKVTARAFGSSYQLPLDESGWEALRETFRIRNRLVHPKKREDLTVTDDELRIANDAHTWFQRVSLAVLRELDAGIKGKRGGG